MALLIAMHERISRRQNKLTMKKVKKKDNKYKLNQQLHRTTIAAR